MERKTATRRALASNGRTLKMGGKKKGEGGALKFPSGADGKKERSGRALPHPIKVAAGGKGGGRGSGAENIVQGVNDCSRKTSSYHLVEKKGRVRGHKELWKQHRIQGKSKKSKKQGCRPAYQNSSAANSKRLGPTARRKTLTTTFAQKGGRERYILVLD